jgi:DNA-binding CsgD family transcriptional regulator
VAGEALGEQRARKASPAIDRKKRGGSVLSPREIEIIKQVAAGLRNMEIGKKLR